MRQRLFASDVAEPITYDGSLIFGHVDYGDGEVRANASKAILEVRREDVPSPAYRDPVIVDGVTWHVYRDDRNGERITGDSISWRIPLTRDERPGVNR